MKLFISYPHKELTKTEKLTDLLTSCGHEVWIDADLRVGESWQQQLRDAIADCDALVLAITPNWIASPYCQWEFVTGIEQGKQIIPVMLEETHLPKRISDIQYEDFTDGFDDAERNEKFCNDLQSLSQQIALQAGDTSTKETAAQRIQQQINQANTQSATFGDFKDSTVTVNQSNIGVQNVTQAEKQRNWTIPVMLGLVLALISTIAGVMALIPEDNRNALLGIPSDTPTATYTPVPTNTPTSTPTNTATPTPTATATPEVIAATDDEILIILAQFEVLSNDAEYTQDILERRLNEALERALELGVNVRIDTTSEIVTTRERARELANEFGATMVIWGVVEPTVLDVNFEIVEQEGQRVDTSVEETRFEAVETPDEIQFRIGEAIEGQYVTLFTIAQILYFEDDFDVVVTLLEDAIGLIGNESIDTLKDLSVSVAYLYLGSSYSEQNLDTQTMDSYNKAIELDPEFAIAYNARGLAHYDLGHEGLALRDFNDAIELDSEFAGVYYNRGMTYYYLGEIDLAISDFSAAIELDSEYVEAYVGRGIVYSFSREYQQALIDLDRAIEINPLYSNAYLVRGLTRYFIGIPNYETSITDFRRYEELRGELPQPIVDAIAEMEAALAAQGD